MKKKNLKKLTLNKNEVSNLGEVKGGTAVPVPAPVKCSSPNACSVMKSCSISFYASDCRWI